MAANYRTIEAVAQIMVEELGRDKAVALIERLTKETVPSGNSSYDVTVLRLFRLTHAQKEPVWPEKGAPARAEKPPLGLRSTLGRRTGISFDDGKTIHSRFEED